ncbi:hypothetical protein [Flavobacterium pectinovorum]|uniref:hypothetical protein n=1 Tax=Flavobacterium pectinovorum TaxID=29533 RepID=UPI001FAB7598|nr:hypothetical protein [Flavobacterium pectinovorum]MCI9844580.1 hypothetical protein [Flavobacterium pectinovorum]
MKKKLHVLRWLALTVFVCSGLTVNAQELRVGALAALPAGDASDVSSFNAAVDASLYFIKINENLSLGATTGYSRFFGKTETVDGLDIDYDDFSFIPIAASGRGLFGKHLVYVADIGYAAGLDDVGGGLFYQAKFGWTNTKIDAFLIYNGISAKESDITVLGLGVSFKI